MYFVNKKLKSISQLCSARMGYSFRQAPHFVADGTTLVIEPKDVTDEGVLTIDRTSRVALTAENRLNKGDILLINRGRFTATVFNGTIKEPCVATSAFLVVTPKNPTQLLPEYLALFFNSTTGQNLFRRLTETTTIPFISLRNLKFIKIPIPPIERQKALATLDQMNKDYARLSARKLHLQNNLVRAGLVSALSAGRILP